MIVELTERHLDEIVRIERICFSEPWPRSAFESEFNQSYSYTWGWVDNGPETPVLAYLIGWLMFEEFHIANLAVDPEHRRQGIGRSLIRFSLDWAEEQGAEKALLEVRASNQAALRLYESFDFKVVMVRKRYYVDPEEDALVLKKKLR